MVEVVGVRFKRSLKVYDFDANQLNLQKGDSVIVETEHGVTLGKVAIPPHKKEKSRIHKGLKKALRKATEEDIYQAEEIRKKELEAKFFCVEKAKELNLAMKVVNVEYFFDGSKAVFYFTADKRIDFRKLVRMLASKFKTRIEMRQIGARDEAKLIGGMGACGRELCCAKFMPSFELVSIKMAKAQGLILNPEEISGRCGRLMCCLAFEFPLYKEMGKKLPKMGKRIKTPLGEGRVVRIDILNERFWVHLSSGEKVEMTPENWLKG